jgi:hypothetical protein
MNKEGSNPSERRKLFDFGQGLVAYKLGFETDIVYL